MQYYFFKYCHENIVYNIWHSCNKPVFYFELVKYLSSSNLLEDKQFDGLDGRDNEMIFVS